MTKRKPYRIIGLAAAFILGVAATLSLGSCTASMSLFWKNQGSSQSTEQSARARVDTLKSPDINLNF